MKKLPFIFVIAIFALSSCNKDDALSEAAAIRKMDKLIAQHPATDADMDNFVSNLCSDIVDTGVWTSYKDGVVKETSLVELYCGMEYYKYSLTPLDLLFFDNGICWRCYSPYSPPNVTHLYNELKWRIDKAAKSIILVDDDLVAKGCKYGQTQLVLRYYGKDMYILDGMLPTEYYEDENYMMRYFVKTDKEREQGRQWYIDHYKNDDI